MLRSIRRVVVSALQGNRRAGLLYDFSVGEMRYDRNSYPRFIGDGMSKLTGSIAPIDHGLTVTLRVTRKSIMFI
jgi:hypothetical protein